MSLRVSRCFRVGLAAAALAGAGLWSPAVWAQAKLTELEAPLTPPQTNTRTNLAPRPVQSALPRNGLLRLEEQLKSSFQFLKPDGSSLQGVPAPPLAPRVAAPVPNRRAKELQEQRKNWIFMTPDELNGLPKEEDPLKAREYGGKGLNDKALSPLERFYQDLEERSAAKNKKRNPLAPEDTQAAFGSERKAEDSNLPAGIRDNATNLRKLLGLETPAFAAPTAHGTFSDIFGMGERRTSPTDEELARKAYLDSFNQWLNRSATPSANNSLARVPGSADPTRAGSPGASSTPAFAPFNPFSRPDNYDPSIGAVNPTLAATAPQDVTAKVLNQWNPYWTPPKVEPPKPKPPQPIFDVPRRKF